MIPANVPRAGVVLGRAGPVGVGGTGGPANALCPLRPDAGEAHTCRRSKSGKDSHLDRLGVLRYRAQVPLVGGAATLARRGRHGAWWEEEGTVCGNVCGSGSQ